MPCDIFYNICRISFPSKEVIYQLALDSRWELLTILASDVFNPWQEVSASRIRKMLRITIVDKCWQKKVLVMISILLEKLSAYTSTRVLLEYWLLLLLLSLIMELFSNFCLIFFKVAALSLNSWALPTPNRYFLLLFYTK